MAEKEFEIDDPMALVGVGVPEGEGDLMASCLVEEYVRIGMTDDQIMAVFANPFFAGSHAIYRARGEECVKALISRARSQWGHPRFTIKESTEA